MIKQYQSENYVNLSNVETIPHLELFDEVSKVIAEETLETVNQNSSPVHPRKSFYTVCGKRTLDIAVSLVALTVTLPVNLVVGICTYFDVGRPIFFLQTREGKDGKPFTIVKFRNMTNETDEQGNLLPPSQRVTRFGKFVRRTSIDELLNFWSILKGDMSLIGPRPLPFEYSDYYSNRHKMRYAVRPGLECPIILPIEGAITWKDQFENDVYYVENVSFATDIRMAWKLVQMVFNKKSKAIRGNAVRGSFMGYQKDGTSVNSQFVEKRHFLEAVKRMGYDVSAYATEADTAAASTGDTTAVSAASN